MLLNLVTLCSEIYYQDISSVNLRYYKIYQSFHRKSKFLINIQEFRILSQRTVYFTTVFAVKQLAHIQDNLRFY